MMESSRAGRCLAGLVGDDYIRPSSALGAGQNTQARIHRRPDGGHGRRPLISDRGRRLVRARLSGWWRTVCHAPRAT